MIRPDSFQALTSAAMKIAIPKERRAYERRVAATPDTVKKYRAMGYDVAVESGAGAEASFPDEYYAAAGAQRALARCAGLQGSTGFVRGHPRCVWKTFARGGGDFFAAEPLGHCRSFEQIAGGRL